MANSDKPKNNKVNQESGSNKNKKKKLPPSKTKRFFKYFFLTILITGLLLSVVGVGYVVAVIKTAPTLDVESIHDLNQTSMYYDNKGEVIDNIPTQEERYKISYEEIPQNLINAYIAIEDERFMTHPGIDVKRIIGAALRDVKVILTGEGGVHGASTLTQQLIKNTLLFEEASNENKADSGPLASVNRKIKEIYLALKLEKVLSKEEIVTAYLNTIPLGGYVYGVEAASRYFFGKKAIDLTLPECAYIAGITQAPSYYSAYNTEAKDYPNTYIDRTETVLMKMLELGFISKDEYDSAYNFTAENQFVFEPISTDYKVKYEWFIYPALEQVRNDLKEKYKYTDEEVNTLFVNGGLKIYTTLDTAMQDAVQAVLDDRNNLDVDWDTNPEDTMTYDDNNGNGVQDEDEISYPLLQAAATVMDYRTGKVLALVGGRGEQPPHSINRAYDDLKPIASTTKPLTVYGPGIDTKIITAATPLDDSPVSSSILNKYGWGSTPLNNYNFKFDGFITARDGIAFSKNITSVKLVDKIGMDTAIEYGEKAGIVYNDYSKTSMAAVALGQHDNRVEDRDGGNTTILASAFGSFGNNGVRNEPILYTKVEDATGKVLLEKEPKATQLFSPQTAYIMYDILKGPITRFDAGGARFSDIPVAGKTGTTDKVDSFWFAGLTPYYSGSVWIGYDMPQSMSGVSSSAADLWGKVMAQVHQGLEYKEIEQPSGIVNATICIDSGKLATDLCNQDQRGGRVRTEMFIEGTQPNSVCDVHVKVKVNKNNNKLATDNTPKGLVEEKVFIKKENASKDAADFPYVVPTEKDDTKPEEKIKLSQIGLKQNMDLYDAIVILNDKGIKYTFVGGESVSGTLTPKTYTLINFTTEIVKDGTVELTIKKLETPPEESPGIGNDNPDTENPGNTPGNGENNGGQDNNGATTPETPTP
ncbi:MAG: transglycosylase domain-containing protein [Clostridium sp.]|nr:transglycosylase domain-containing protein [Clostridium sp.]